MSERDDSKVSQQAPASNPGADDPSGGIAAGSGGVSSAAYINSPVPSEQKSIVQSTVDTVKSYLPSLAGLSLVGSGSEEPEAKDADGDEGGSKVAAAAGGVAAAASTAAVAVGLKSDSDAPTDSADATTSSDSKVDVMADSTPKDGTKTDTANLVSQAKDGEKSTDLAPTDREKELSTAKTDTEGAQPGEGGGGSEETSGGNEGQKSSGKKENPEAIPTAGGERLGEKNWGESKVVPDLPKEQKEGSQQVSSEEGQPDKTTQDNTAQNTGGAAPPPASTSAPSSSSPAPASGEKESDEKEKQSFKDKMKSKLHIGSKKS